MTAWAARAVLALLTAATITAWWWGLTSTPHYPGAGPPAPGCSSCGPRP